MEPQFGPHCWQCPLWNPYTGSCQSYTAHLEEVERLKSKARGEEPPLPDDEWEESDEGTSSEESRYWPSDDSAKTWGTPPPGTWWDAKTSQTALFTPEFRNPSLWIDPRFYGLKQRLLSVLKDNSIKRYLTGKVRGRIDIPGLHRIRTGSDDVFKDRAPDTGKDYACVFCVDLSGSMCHPMNPNGFDMSGNRWNYYIDKTAHRNLPLKQSWPKSSRVEVAAELSTQLAYTLESIGVPTVILGYNHVVTLFKKAGDTHSPHIIRNAMMKSSYNNGGCNHDLAALIELEKHLKEQSSPKTQVFAMLLSDGAPAGCGSVMWRGELTRVSDTSACSEQWRYIKKHWPGLAIGIGCRIQDIYEQARTINSADELSAQVIGGLSHVIRRVHR